MNKTELIDAVAGDTGMSKSSAGEAVNSALDLITKSLAKGQEVTLVGFGTFKISKRAERMGRNPQTGEEIRIAACSVPVFRAGKPLKTAVNK